MWHSRGSRWEAAFCVCHGARWSADSPNPSRVDAFTSMQDVGTHGNPLEPIGTHGNPLEPIGTPVPEGRFSSLFPFRLPVFSSLLPWTTGRVSERRFVGDADTAFPFRLGTLAQHPQVAYGFIAVPKLVGVLGETPSKVARLIAPNHLFDTSCS